MSRPREGDELQGLPLFSQTPTELAESMVNVGKAMKRPMPPAVREAGRILSLHKRGLLPEAEASDLDDLRRRSRALVEDNTATVAALALANVTGEVMAVTPVVITPEQADALRRGLSIGAPSSNPTTSRAAAESIMPNLGDLEALVLRTIKLQAGPNGGWIDMKEPGMTCDEVEICTGLTHQCASARIRGLVLKGKLKESGRQRPTRTGRNAIVWVVA